MDLKPCGGTGKEYTHSRLVAMKAEGDRFIL